MKKIKIYLVNNTLFSNSSEAFNFAHLKKLGEINQGKVIYSSYEALYLIENNRATLEYKNKELEREEATKIFSKEKNFTQKYSIFRDLEKKGYIVKTALKFGLEFRVYKKSNEHAIWLVYPVINNKIELKEIIAKVRIAHSTAKKLLIAVVDSEQDISYYELDWVKP
ncbi:MAG: tRNA-intron lyase [Candidatus Nanoarchaeia archaeon]